jgi:hypothetical protein
VTGRDPLLERCACGAALDPSIDWCPQCYQPRPAAAADTRFGAATGRPAPSPGQTGTVPLPAPSTKRYGATALTFGLPLRIVLTVLVTAPLVIGIVLTFRFGSWVLGFCVTGAYSGFLYPKLMRDLWRRTDRPLNP